MNRLSTRHKDMYWKVTSKEMSIENTTVLEDRRRIQTAMLLYLFVFSA